MHLNPSLCAKKSVNKVYCTTWLYTGKRNANEKKKNIYNGRSSEEVTRVNMGYSLHSLVKFVCHCISYFQFAPQTLRECRVDNGLRVQTKIFLQQLRSVEKSFELTVEQWCNEFPHSNESKDLDRLTMDSTTHSSKFRNVPPGSLFQARKCHQPQSVSLDTLSRFPRTRIMLST